MEKEEILNLIAKKGYLTLTELKEAFQGDNIEILEMKLTYLVQKNRIRQAEFQSSTDPDVLFYCPKE